MEYIYKGQISVGQSNLPSFLAAAQHLEISGLDQLKTGDRDGSRELDQDQGSQPQDLSIKTQLRTNKRMRVSELYSAGDICSSYFLSSLKHKRPQSSHVRNNLISSQNLESCPSDNFPLASEDQGYYKEKIKTMKDILNQSGQFQ